MIEFTKYLIKEFKEEPSKSVNFFRSHKAYGYIIWLTLMDNYFADKKTSIEEIIEVAIKYSSRRTVNNFLIKAYKSKFIEREDSKMDKRIVHIRPSRITVIEYSEWATKFLKSMW